MKKKVRIEYLLNETGRKKSLLEGGDGKELQIIEADITPEILERAAVHEDGSAVLKVSYIATDAEIIGTYNFDSYRLDVGDSFYNGHKPRIREIVKKVHFDAPQTVESLLAFIENAERKVSEKMAELELELPKKIALWEQAVADHKARAARVEAENQAREAAEKAEREQREKDKNDWVAAYGSDFLKRAVALGYNCQRRYVTERAAVELPGFAVDFDGLARWKPRACPSEKALKEVEKLIERGYEAEVVWLTHPESDCLDDFWGFQSCEAIVINNYLGKYDLVKIV